MSDPAPKLIIDDDWKSQAQAEKDRLAEAEAAKAAAPGKGAGAQAEGELPPADFQSLVGMLITQALMYLGGVADPRTGQAIFDPEMARFYIDLIGVLETKTKGNLSADETRDLTQALHELRVRYVELTTLMARQAAQSAMRGAGGGQPAGGPGPVGLKGV